MTTDDQSKVHYNDDHTTIYKYVENTIKTTLRCKEKLFEDIACGLEPLKTSLRCKERPLEDIENSKKLPLRGRPGGP